MGRDAGNDRLAFNDFAGKWFVADEAGVSRLKRDVRKRAQKFLYLRKGEDFGAVIQMLLEAYNSGATAIEAIWNAYSASGDVNLAGITLDSLLESDFVKWLLLYTAISGGKELIIKDAKRMQAVLTSAAHWVAGPRIKILCTPKAINVRAGLGWRALGAKIRNYLDERSSGSHRYYLSEREFAFFIRQPDESFLGFHGEDEELLATLKNAFEAEWDANEPPNLAMQPDGPSGCR